MNNERFKKVNLGDRYGSINDDGQVFREPFSGALKRPQPITQVPQSAKKALSAEEIMDKFFRR